MTLSANWSYPTAIRFGAGRIAELADACKSAGISRPLLVTDRGLAQLPITQQAMDILHQGGLNPALFSEVDPNPTEVNLEAGIMASMQAIMMAWWHLAEDPGWTLASLLP